MLRVGRHSDRAALAASYFTVHTVLWTFHFYRTVTLGGQTDRQATPGTDLVLTQPRTVGTDRQTDRIGIAIVDLMLRAGIGRKTD